MTAEERDRRKLNPKRAASAAKKLHQITEALQELKRKPNKTLADNAVIRRLESQRLHWQNKAQQKSEIHARRPERH
jgi:hypothetical protein